MPEPTKQEIDALFHKMAEAALADGVSLEVDTEYKDMADWSRRNIDSPLAQWVRTHASYRPESEFFVVWLLAVEMGKIKQASREGKR